ncbi:uncharacterized protein LOC144155656 isoform X2 [Haemaphysalis longicornis]
MDKTASFLTLCLDNDVPAVRRFLKNGIPVDVQDVDGVTGLQIAATNGYTVLAQHLTEEGANVNLANNCGWTPLMHAAQHGHVPVVMLLLQQGAAVNETSFLGAGALSLAAAGGHHSTVCLLLEAGADITDRAGHSTSGLTPLAAAAVNGHVSIVELLLQRGSCTNHCLPATGTSPLMLAASAGHLRVAQILMDQNANPNHQDFSGRTALDVATISSKTEVAEYLRSMTHSTPNQGNMKSLKEILKQHPCCANWCHPKTGITPLMQAAVLGYMDAAVLLVKNNADIELQDHTTGWTALMHAVYHRHTNVVRYLISSGADVCAEAFNGATALDIACFLENGEAKVIQMLADQIFARFMSSSALENERESSDLQQSKTFKGWIDQLTQKLALRKSRPSLPKSFSQATTLAQDLESLTDLPKHGVMPALDISFTSPEPTFPEVDAVFSRVPPSFPDYDKMLDMIPAAMPDCPTQINLQKITRRATEPKFLHHLRQPSISRLVSAVEQCGDIKKCGTFDEKHTLTPRQLEQMGSEPNAHPSLSTLKSKWPHNQPEATPSPEADNVVTILKALGLDKYAKNFKDNEVDWEAFVTLDQQSIEAIGVKTEENREVLQEAINQLWKMQQKP